MGALVSKLIIASVSAITDLVELISPPRTVVGIDFGAAFGVGTTELPVPEMIPFRLTNQFQNLLQPLDSVGLLKG